MVTVIPPGDPASTTVLDTLALLISKEGHEIALEALTLAIVPHLKHLLQSSIPLSSTTSSSLCRELGSSKLSIRRLLSNAVGEATWSLHIERAQLFSTEGQSLLSILAPVFETNLVTAANNLAVNSAGFLEGYVATALGWGPLQQVSSVNKLTGSPTLAGLLTISPKPSYLLNERIYAKLPASYDAHWLLRCMEAMVMLHGEGMGSASLRYVTNIDLANCLSTAVGLVFIHLAFDSKASEVRREAKNRISHIMQYHPRPLSRLIREGLASWLGAHDNKAVAKSKLLSDEDGIINSKSRDIGQLLSAVFAPNLTATKSVLEDIGIDYLILAHHPEINEEAQTSWIGLVQSLRMDPAMIASENKEKILKSLWDAAGVPPQVW